MREIQLQPGHTELEVKNALASRQFVYAECFTITPLEGPPMTFTDAQNDVSVVTWGTIDRHIYLSKRVIITGLRSRSTIGMEVDEQTAEIAFGDDELFQNDLNWPLALKQGRLDGATITRDRYIATAWGGDYTDWLGGVRMFAGNVSDLDRVGRSSASVKVKSSIEKLSKPMPRDLFTPVCRKVWGSTRCGVNQEDHAVLGTIDTGPITRTAIPWASSDPKYGLGKILIANSDDVTRVRTVLRATSTHLYLVYPLDFDPVEGLEFTAYPGCCRLFEGVDGVQGCSDYHVDPEERFGGYPFVPVAETAA